MLTVQRSISNLSLNSASPSRSSGWTDIYKASHYGAPVALKVFRCHGSTNKDKFKKLLFRELAIWRHLDHPNILPFLGACDVQDMGDSSLPAIVSPWHENGNISRYLRCFPDVDRLHLIVTISDGLRYLHSRGIVHGNLHPGNILITDSGTALLSDFNLTTLRRDAKISADLLNLDYIRYMPPEHVISDKVPTFAYDNFSFGSVSFEVMSSTKPFVNHLSPVDIVLALFEGERPFDRPSKRVIPSSSRLDELLWDLMCQCWNIEPDWRPEMHLVHDVLQKMDAEVTPSELKARL